MVPKRIWTKTHDILPPLLKALQPFAVPLEALETTNGEGRIPPTSCQRHQKSVEDAEASKIFRLSYLDNTQIVYFRSQPHPSDRQIFLKTEKNNGAFTSLPRTFFSHSALSRPQGWLALQFFRNGTFGIPQNYRESCSTTHTKQMGQIVSAKRCLCLFHLDLVANSRLGVRQVACQIVKVATRASLCGCETEIRLA